MMPGNDRLASAMTRLGDDQLRATFERASGAVDHYDPDRLRVKPLDEGDADARELQLAASDEIRRRERSASDARSGFGGPIVTGWQVEREVTVIEPLPKYGVLGQIFERVCAILSGRICLRRLECSGWLRRRAFSVTAASPCLA
jgi:hypothetical protein